MTLHNNKGDELHIISPTANTIGQLLQAERINLSWGQGITVRDTDGQTPAYAADIRWGPYTIDTYDKRQPKETPTGLLIISLVHQDTTHMECIRPGQFLFEVLRKLGIHDTVFLADDSGRVYGADFRVWRSLKLHTISRSELGIPHRMVQPITASGPQQTRQQGLNEHTIRKAMQDTLASLTTHTHQQVRVIGPRMAHHILCTGHTPTLADGQSFFCIFPAQGHWALLFGTKLTHNILWTYWDGLEHPLQQEAQRLANCWSKALGFEPTQIIPRQTYKQQQTWTCGTIALAHLLQCVGVQGTLTQAGLTQLHDWLTKHQTEGGITANGPTGQAELKANLANLLHSKGVPGELARDRATQVLEKIGLQNVQQALTSKNPWAKLKAEANRPNISFRLILPHELSQHIQSQASDKFGTAISTSKKQQKNKPDRKQPTPVQADPEYLELFQDDFVTALDDTTVKPIQLTAVVAEARGIALCTLSQALPFIQTNKSISTDALALALTELPEDNIITKANITKTLIPAKHKGTGEPILLQGGLFQLGDIHVQRAKVKNITDPEVVTTAVLRMQVYRDLWQGDWYQFTRSPIREVIHWLPALKRCKEADCEKGAILGCNFTHPAVDEEFSQVIFDLWARNFTTSVGKRTTPEDSESFSVFIRVPRSALDNIMEQQPRGVFLEPRATDTRGPDPAYKIIWIPGATYDSAAHLMKTYSKAICLMRMRQRYGIRVHKKEEEGAFHALRPGDTYDGVDVTLVFRIYPVPHGTQRASIAALLREWSWQARPMQPTKGDSTAMAWLVGASTKPPKNTMPGFKGELIITEVRSTQHTPTPQTLVASRRAQEHIRKEAQQAKASTDPWQEPAQDPWQQYRQLPTPARASAASTTTRLEELAKDLKAEMKKDLAQEVQSMQPQQGPREDTRLVTLESGLAELQSQSTKYNQWFNELGGKCNQLQQAVHDLKDTATQQQADMSSLKQDMQRQQTNIQEAMQSTVHSLKTELTQDMTSRFDNLEELLRNSSKRSRLSPDENMAT